jgi:hypothetical protein
MNAAEVNILGGSVRIIKKNTDALVVASKVRLEVNANKTKYMVMSRDLNAGRINNIRNENSSFERAGEFKYLGTTLMSTNSTQKKKN